MDPELVGYLDERFAYLDQRFGAVDQRFDAMDRRFDRIERRQDATDARLQDTRCHLGVLIKNLDGKIQLVAEGVIAVDQKTEIGEVKTLLTFSYTDLDRLVRRREAEGE